jgi:hypothetical protein
MTRKRSIAFLFFALFLLVRLRDAEDRGLGLAEISHMDGEGTVYTTQGPLPVQLREIQTELTSPDGTRSSLDILVLFEPFSGQFFWKVSRGNPESPAWRICEFRRSHAAFLKDGAIVYFRTFWGRDSIFVRHYRGRASDMEDAERRTLRDASYTIDLEDPFATETKGYERQVPLAGLDRLFVTLPHTLPGGTIVGRLTPRITAVRWDGRHWVVTVRCRWTEEVTLDANYSLVSIFNIGS